MGREKKDGKPVVTQLAPSLKAKFKSHCKKMGVSMAQRLRDLVQLEVKEENN